MSAESTGLSARIRFRHWRWQRPFWAGLLTILAGLPIAYFPYANLTLGQLTVRMATTAGSGSLIIGVLLVVLGLTMWFQPLVRVFAGVATILLALVSLVVSNFGGFLVGFLLGLFGGALAVAWAPGTRAADEPGDKAALPDWTPDAGTDVGTDVGADDGVGEGPEAQAVAAGAGADDMTTIHNDGRHRAG